MGVRKPEHMNGRQGLGVGDREARAIVLELANKMPPRTAAGSKAKAVTRSYSNRCPRSDIRCPAGWLANGYGREEAEESLKRVWRFVSV
jgi:Holliday junction resolvasome RuvABC DNA-binding subunit